MHNKLAMLARGYMILEIGGADRGSNGTWAGLTTVPTSERARTM